MDQTGRLNHRAITLSASQYWQAILSLLGRGSILGYWPLEERTGAAVREIVNGRNGTQTGVTWAAVASPVHGRAPTVSVANINIYTAALAAAFNSAEGSVLWWGKTPNWADGLNTCAAYFAADGSNRIYAQKTTTGIMQMRYTAAGVSKLAALPTQTGTGWMHFAFRWSKSDDRLSASINGYTPVAPTTALGNLVGSLAADGVRIGEIAANTWQWNGNLSHMILLNREASDAEVRAVSRLATLKLSNLSVLGDSISANYYDWPYAIAPALNKGSTHLDDHAVAGQSIVTHLATQAAAAAADRAHRIIIALGTNDDNAGDMGALQAKAEAGIAALKASNPPAAIYWLNVLPRWTDAGGATPVDKANVRAAIAAACAAQGITCWDTVTAPWISAAQTSDGVHPNPAGTAAIAAQVLARL